MGARFDSDTGKSGLPLLMSASLSQSSRGGKEDDNNAGRIGMPGEVEEDAVVEEIDHQWTATQS